MDGMGRRPRQVVAEYEAGRAVPAARAHEAVRTGPLSDGRGSDFGLMT